MRRVKLVVAIIFVAALTVLATACGSHPKNLGQCRVYLSDDAYRVTVYIYGKGTADSVKGHDLLLKACQAVDQLK